MEKFEQALAKARRDKAEGATQARLLLEPAPEERPRADHGQKRVQTEPPIALVALDYSNPVADLFRILRTRTLTALIKIESSTLGICSAREGEGKTFVAANLAASIGLSEEHSVLLIDLNLRRPGIHEYFQLSRSPGITDFLGGNVRLSECVRTSAVPRLEVVTAGTPIRNSSEALGSSELAKAFTELIRALPSRITICDLPPLLASDDDLIFSSKLGGVLLVVEENRTRPGDIQRSLDLLTSTRVLGTVLNKSRYGNSFNYPSDAKHSESI